MNRARVVLAGAVLLALGDGLRHGAEAQTCTTQSQMKPEDRLGLAAAATRLAQEMQANDQAGVKAGTVAEFANNFSGVAEVLSETAPHLKGGRPEVEQVYVLDASTLKAAADTQFYCTLNQSQEEADFSIPQLPPGRYGFAMVRMEEANPWRLSFLLRQEQGKWLMAGLYPKTLTAAGHDGLWYWTEGRAFRAKKEAWNAWLYFQEAQGLLQPAGFVSSTHLEKLADERTAAAPPEMQGNGAITPAGQPEHNGLNADAPLVIKGKVGAEFRFTSISVDDSLGKEKVDVAAHLKVDALGDATSARQRNLSAMAALVYAHPELRTAFHGVWIFADAPGQSPYATEGAMNEIQ